MGVGWGGGEGGGGEGERVRGWVERMGMELGKKDGAVGTGGGEGEVRGECWVGSAEDGEGLCYKSPTGFGVSQTGQRWMAFGLSPDCGLTKSLSTVGGGRLQPSGAADR